MKVWIHNAAFPSCGDRRTVKRVIIHLFRVRLHIDGKIYDNNQLLKW